MIYADKQEVQGDGPFLDGINVTIRRNYIYEDAYDKLSPENGMHASLYVMYVILEKNNHLKMSVYHLVLQWLFKTEMKGFKFGRYILSNKIARIDK